MSGLHVLDGKPKQLLADILQQTTIAKEGVDALRYRAEHEDSLDLLDTLERDGYLRKENDKYWVSLTALIQLNTPRSDEILRKSEVIFSFLKAYYKNNQRDHLLLSDLAKKSNLALEDLKECLSYMVEGSWWGGRSTDFYTDENPNIKPSEIILKYTTFVHVVDQLRSWQFQRINDRLVHDRYGHQMYPWDVKNSQTHTQRDKPVWHGKLPVDIRTLLDEVYLALENDMSALPSMGLRTVIDMVCVDLVGDVGSFNDKLKALRKDGHVSDREIAILGIAIDVGSASAHRGHNPNKEDLNTLLDICEYLLKGVYVLPGVSQVLKATTPPRD